VDMERLITITGKEKETIRAALQDGRTHWIDSASFPDSGTCSLDPARQPSAAAALIITRAAVGCTAC
jgi:hypothetical protein